MNSKPTRAEVEALRQKIVDLVMKSPGKAATILAAWVNHKASPGSTSSNPSHSCDKPNKKAG